MAWKYSEYNEINVGITVGLVLFIMFGVFFTFHHSPKGKEFITDRIIGVDGSEAENENSKTNKMKNKSPDSIKKSAKHIGRFLCFLAGYTLSIVAILMFQGCFLSTTRVFPYDNCPEYPMDCFIFNDSSATPITDYISFRCNPLNETQFPLNMTNGMAMCYGWIFKFQTTKDILDQLGTCTGLIGNFTTLLAIIVYLGKCKRTLFLSLIFTISCTIFFIISLTYRWSYAPLTYAVFGLGISLGIFGLFLFCILPNENQVAGNTEQPVSTPKNNQISSDSSTVLPDRIEVLH